MSDELTFAMGKFEARFPRDRWYSENHLWLREAAGGFRVGLTSYSVRLLQDVYFLEWSIDPGTTVAAKQSIGEIESSKAISDLYAPVAGVVKSFNSAILNDPSAINTDGYGEGWLYEFDTQAKLLTADEYIAQLDGNWEKAQRMIKGQLND
ncbi:MAG: glycine cleavage system protein H [Planctomycetaceae bacterium]